MNRIKEGEILNKYMARRFRNNKNLLQAITGATGSGKTYLGLRECELWYDSWFHEPYPIKNVCFSVSELMRRLSSKELREGDLLMLEEAGVNLGSSDWQFKIVKMFNYILQSFRNMNVGIIMTLPVLSMLAKQARQLLHCHIITQSIDFSTNISKSKCLFHQLNQLSGKSYWKYMRMTYKGKIVAIERIGYGLPSETLRKEYEAKKTKFVADLTDEFSAELDKIEFDKMRKNARKDLNPYQQRVYDLRKQGLTFKEIGKKEGKATASVYSILQTCKKLGYLIDFEQISQEKRIFKLKS